MLETLETRTLFSAATNDPMPYPMPPVDDMNVIPTLVIEGSEAADTITLSQSGNTLKVTRERNTNLYDLTQYVKIVIRGNGGDDRITANSTVTRRLEITGGAGTDSITGGSGNDWIFGGVGVSAFADPREYGNDVIHGGAGNDTISGSRWAGCTIFGDAGDDSIYGYGGMDSLYGGANNDRIRGGDAIDTIEGGAGNDTLYGGNGYDILRGQSGNDSLYGEAGDDDLFGGIDHDLLDGGEGNDDEYGEDGADTFYAGIADNGADDHFGGAGVDTISYRDRAAAVMVSLDGVANDGAAGGGEGDQVVGVEKIWGGAGDDILAGNDDANYLYGEAGNDLLRGNGGDDFLYGWFGNDRIFAGDGEDWLFGEQGNDVLVSIGGGNRDHQYGGTDWDNFWLDADATETHDAAAFEIAAGNVHRIGSFENFGSKELNSPNIPDPGLFDNDTTDSSMPFYERMDDTKPLFAGDGAGRDDVRQGAVGTCSFMSALAGIAGQYGRRIENSVVDLGDGTFAVRLFASEAIKPLDWTERYVRVDKDFARDTGSGFDLWYAGWGQEASIWVAVMEKALATLEGNYANIDGMSLGHAFRRLGLSGDSFWGNNASTTLQQIKSKLAAGKVVTVETRDDQLNPDSEQYAENHAYTVVSVAPDLSSITLRNPWGNDGTDAVLTTPAEIDAWMDGYVTYTAADFINYFIGARYATVPGA